MNLYDVPSSSFDDPWLKDELPREYAAAYDSRAYYPAYPVAETPASVVEAWEKCIDEINSLGTLEHNWDGYGGHAIGEAAMNAALRACVVFATANLPAPEASPKSSGTIGLSWELSDAEAYLEIGNTTFSGYLSLPDYEPALLGGPVDEIGPALLYPLVMATSGFDIGGHGISGVQTSAGIEYGIAA